MLTTQLFIKMKKTWNAKYGFFDYITRETFKGWWEMDDKYIQKQVCNVNLLETKAPIILEVLK